MDSQLKNRKNLKSFLRAALLPVGRTLYVYGGGWNWQNEGACIQTRGKGLSDEWGIFFLLQDENYDYKEQNPADSYYPYFGYNSFYYAGLDCSGYVGWALYQILGESGMGDRTGFVMRSDLIARTMARKGWGSWTKSCSYEAGDSRAGDIVSICGHVWISLGTCPDKSILIVHSTPSISRTGYAGGGVQLGAVGLSEDCIAYKLAEYYMHRISPEWCRRYRVCLKAPEVYLDFSEKENGIDSDTGCFRWNIAPGSARYLADLEGCQGMPAKKLCNLLLEKMYDSLGGGKVL